MNRFNVKCPSCGRPVPAEWYNVPGLMECHRCSRKLEVFAFPALYRHGPVLESSKEAQLDDATCFYHAEKRADAVCDDCGRFLCGLCSLPFNDETLCASCLEFRRKDDGLHALKGREMRHDKLAVMLALSSTLMMLFSWWFPIVPCALALATLYVAIRYWKHKPSFQAGRYRIRLLVASCFSIILAVSSVLMAVAFFRELIHG